MWGDCDCRCGPCPITEPLVLDSWTGSKTISLDFRSYPGWRSAFENLSGAVLTWELWVVGGRYMCGADPNSYAVATPKPLFAGTVSNGQIRTNAPSSHVDNTPPYPQGWDFSPCPFSGDLALFLSPSGGTCPTAWAINGGPFSSLQGPASLQFELRLRCWPCSAGREQTRTLYPWLWDDMHLDSVMCDIDSQTTRFAQSECKPEVVLMTDRFALGGSSGYDLAKIANLRSAFGELLTIGNPVYARDPLTNLNTYTFSGMDLTRIEMMVLVGQLPECVGSLAPLLDWLAIGGKMLVIDTGYVHSQWLADLGISAAWDYSDGNLPNALYPRDSLGNPFPGSVVNGIAAAINQVGSHPSLTGVSDPLVSIATNVNTGGCLKYVLSIINPYTPVTALGNFQGTLTDDAGTCTPTVVNYPAIGIEDYLGSWVVTTSYREGNQFDAAGLSDRAAVQWLRNLYDLRHLF